MEEKNYLFKQKFRRITRLFMNNYDTNYFYFHYSYIFFKKYYYLYNKKIFKKILKRKKLSLIPVFTVPYIYCWASLRTTLSIMQIMTDSPPSLQVRRGWGCFRCHSGIPSDMQVPKGHTQPRVGKGRPLTDLVASSSRPSWMRLDSYARLFLYQEKSENTLGL